MKYARSNTSIPRYAFMAGCLTKHGAVPFACNTQNHLHTFYKDIIQGKITEQKKYYIHRYIKHIQNSEETNYTEYISEMEKQSFNIMASALNGKIKYC
jgi:hypothetical protein